MIKLPRSLAFSLPTNPRFKGTSTILRFGKKLRKVELRLRLSEDGAEAGTENELLHLIQYRGDVRIALRFLHGIILLPEWNQADPVFYSGNDLVTESLVSQQSRKPEQGRAGSLNECQERSRQNLLRPNTPAVREYLAQDSEDGVGVQYRIARKRQRVEPDRIAVAGVNDDDVVDPIIGDALQNVRHEVGFRVENQDAAPLSYIGKNQVLHRRRLTTTGWP